MFEINTGFVYQCELETEVEDVLVQVWDEEEEIESLTTSQTRFKLGPYMSNKNYTLSFQKEGYRFSTSSTSDNNLVRVLVKVERLGTIRIEIRVLRSMTNLCRTQKANRCRLL